MFMCFLFIVFVFAPSNARIFLGAPHWDVGGGQEVYLNVATLLKVAEKIDNLCCFFIGQKSLYRTSCC